MRWTDGVRWTGPRPPVAHHVTRALPLLAALVVALLAHPAIPPRRRPAYVFPAIADASVRADHPSRNDGTGPKLRVGRRWATYVRFDVRVPAGERITSARLVVHPQKQLTIRRASNDWREKRITWRHRPHTGVVDRRLRRTGTVTYALTSTARKAKTFASRERGSGPRIVVRTTVGSTTVDAGSGSSVTTPIGGAPTPSDPSGESVPLGDIPGWVQVFSEDFGTDVPLGGFPQALSSKWWAYPSPWKDSMRRGTYNPARTLSVAGGVLSSHIHSEAGVPQVSGVLPRLPGTSGGVTGTPSGRLYGRYTVRFRCDPIAGYKIAWLLVAGR